MKFLTNLIAVKDCLQDYCDSKKLNNFATECNLDGYEIICAGEYPKEIKGINVLGIHLPFFNTWLDFYNQNTEKLIIEFGSKAVWEDFYGSDSFDFLYKQFEHCPISFYHQ